MIKTELKLDLANFNLDLIYGCYQLTFTEANFKVFCDINSMPRIGSSEETPICSDFPQLPVNDVGEFQCSNEIGELEKKTTRTPNC